MRREIAALAILTLLVCHVDRTMAQDGRVPTEETRKPLTKASGQIRIMGGIEMGLTTPELVAAVIANDSTLTRKAIIEVSPEAATSGEQVANISWANDGLLSPPGIATLVVEVNSFDKRVPAQDLLQRLPNILENRFPELDVAHQFDIERRDSLTEQLNTSRIELGKLKDQCHQLARLHNVPINAEVAAQQEARLDAQIEAISAQLEGLTARREVLEKLIAEVGKRGAEEAAKEPVIAELQQAVALRAEIVKRMRENKAPSVEVLSAESQLAEHKAELAKMRRDITQAAGGQRLAELVRRLEDASVEQAEAKATSKALVTKRDYAIGFSASLEILRIELAQMESSYREVAQELDKLRRKLRLYQPPRVTLLPAQ
jgi:hypothetical protein